MPVAMLVLGELRCRWGTAVVAALLVGLGVLAVLGTDALARDAADVTRRVQRDIGTTLVLLPKGADTSGWWLQRTSTQTLPQDAADRLEASGLAGRLIPMVRRIVRIGETDVLLTGIGEERSGGRKPVFAPKVHEDGAIVGATVGREMGVQIGDMLPLPGGEVRVGDVLLPQGSIDDSSVFLPLDDVQRRLGLVGRLTEIEALECRCGPDVDDPVAYIQMVAARAVPEAVVIRRHAAAQARSLQRDLADSIVAVAPPVAAWVALALIGGMAWLNVRERRAECGMLRALGWTRASVLGVLLGRWLVVGLIGGSMGLLVALVVLQPTSALWWWSLAGAPVAAVLAGSLPAMVGASADPVEALRT